MLFDTRQIQYAKCCKFLNRKLWIKLFCKVQKDLHVNLGKCILHSSSTNLVWITVRDPSKQFYDIRVCNPKYRNKE